MTAPATSQHEMVDDAGPVGLIGGIGLTEVHVYAQRPAPDGKFSGCPHIHAVTDEGYFVLQGRGEVEFHDLEHGFRRLALEPGHYVHFPPLMMHRLISDGHLVILGMMGNAGLAERGEARIYFGRTVDEDASRFEELLSLPKRLGLEGALQRRDAAVDAYMGFVKLWAEDRDAYFAELRRFISVHCSAMQTKRQAFAEQVANGPMAWGAQTLRRIEQLPHFSPQVGDVQLNQRGCDTALGMCGVLRPVLTLQALAGPAAGDGEQVHLHGAKIS